MDKGLLRDSFNVYAFQRRSTQLEKSSRHYYMHAVFVPSYATTQVDSMDRGELLKQAKLFQVIDMYGSSNIYHDRTNLKGKKGTLTLT